jgi:polysaccharide biosynthesis transport protein
MNTSQQLIVTPKKIGFNRAVNALLPEKELTIKDLSNLLVRRRAIILSVLAVSVTAAALVCVFSTRRYLATAQIQVQKESASQLGLGAADGSSSFSDALQDNINIQSQATILESPSLALRVIRDLKLASSQDFKPGFSLVGWVQGLVSPAGPSDAQLGPANEADFGLSPRQRMHVLSVFAKYLQVKPLSGTRMIDISYLSSSPRLAAEVVNHLVQGLSDYNFETRHTATSSTVSYLTGQLTDLRKQSEQRQAELARAQRDSGVVSLGGVDAQGREQVYSAVIDKLQQATTAYTQAESNRMAKDAVYQATKTRDPEAISNLSGSAMFSSANTEGALGLIQSLRVQQATLKGQIAELSAKFGPAYPKLGEMKEHLDTLDFSIRTEVMRLGQRAKNDADVSRAVENSASHIYVKLKAQADALNDKTIAYTILRQEADQSRALYETLFKQLKEAGVLADFKPSNISIVDSARVPAKPAKPNVLLYFAASLAGGLFFGGCAALLRDTLDTKIRSLSDFQAQLGQVPFGFLPYQQKTRRSRRSARTLTTGAYGGPSLEAGSESLTLNEDSQILALTDPFCQYVEGVRALRTSILLSRGGSPPQVILVTSSIAAEGKSMLSVNLATLMAQQGKRVLLVDGDLRRPGLHRSLNIPNEAGLSSLLAAHAEIVDSADVGLSVREVPGLKILTAGAIPPYPAELLGSEEMRRVLLAWRGQFDFVLIDAAPVLPVTDSVVLSTMADFTVLLARHDMTERQSLDRSYRLLQGLANHTKIGIILNAVRLDSSAYQEYYGYSNFNGYGSERYA